MKKAILVVACFALTALLIPSVFACYECGKVTGGGHTRIGSRVETPAGSFGFNAMCTKKGLKGELQYVDHTTGDKVHAHELEELRVWEENPGNKPYPRRHVEFWGYCTLNHEEGYTVAVHLHDEGEPGTDDRFYLAVWTGMVDPYTTLDTPILEGGSGTEAMLVGNTQTHKPMPGI